MQWRELSDARLRTEIERACGRVFIGFKEAGASRGVDEQGRSITAPETVERMKVHVQEQGITIEHQFALIPTIVARMPARLDLVRALREHPNVDSLEPIFPGRWE